MKTKLWLTGLVAVVAALGFQGTNSSKSGSGKAKASQATTTPASASRVLNQYCVGCHNDKTKTANFSLENADLTAVANHPDVWERVIRKMRAGMMPPAGLPRPPLATYNGLRDWLETEIDR